MRTVKPIKLQYIPGDVAITQGHKRTEYSHFSKRGAYVDPMGFGNAREVTPSDFILIFQEENEIDQISIARCFKARGIRLTKRRREALEKYMPDTINLVVRKKLSGENYFTIRDDDMEEWLAAAGIK